MNYLKPQKPISNGEDYIYPLTAADQVIRSDGSKLEIDGFINADLFEGKSANFFATKEFVQNKAPFSFGIDEEDNYGYYDNNNNFFPFDKSLNFTVKKSEVTKGDTAKSYTYTVEEKGKYLVKAFNTSCEGYDCSFTFNTENGTNIIFANDDVISSTTSKSRTRILLAYCEMKKDGVISFNKTSAAGYGIHGFYVYKIN